MVSFAPKEESWAETIGDALGKLGGGYLEGQIAHKDLNKRRAAFKKANLPEEYADFTPNDLHYVLSQSKGTSGSTPPTSLQDILSQLDLDSEDRDENKYSQKTNSSMPNLTEGLRPKSSPIIPDMGEENDLSSILSKINPPGLEKSFQEPTEEVVVSPKKSYTPKARFPGEEMPKKPTREEVIASYHVDPHKSLKHYYETQAQRYKTQYETDVKNADAAAGKYQVMAEKSPADRQAINSAIQAWEKGGTGAEAALRDAGNKFFGTEIFTNASTAQMMGGLKTLFVNTLKGVSAKGLNQFMEKMLAGGLPNPLTPRSAQAILLRSSRFGVDLETEKARVAEEILAENEGRRPSNLEELVNHRIKPWVDQELKSVSDYAESVYESQLPESQRKKKEVNKPASIAEESKEAVGPRMANGIPSPSSSSDPIESDSSTPHADWIVEHKPKIYEQVAKPLDDLVDWARQKMGLQPLNREQGIEAAKEGVEALIQGGAGAAELAMFFPELAGSALNVGKRAAGLDVAEDAFGLGSTSEFLEEQGIGSPKSGIQRFARRLGGGLKTLAGLGVGASAQGLRELGVPEKIVAPLEIGSSLIFGRKPSPQSIKQYHKSGMAKLGYEKIAPGTKITKSAYDKTIKAAENEVNTAIDKLKTNRGAPLKAPDSSDWSAGENLFKGLDKALLGVTKKSSVSPVREAIKSELNTLSKSKKTELYTSTKKHLEERLNSLQKDIPTNKKLSAEQWTKFYRDVNQEKRDLSKLHLDPSQYRAAQQALEKVRQQAEKGFLETVGPSSKAAKIFLKGNEQWRHLHERESVGQFLDQVRGPNRAQALLEYRKPDGKELRRDMEKILGKSAAKQFDQILKDLEKIPHPSQVLSGVDQHSLSTASALMLSGHPKIATAVGIGKGAMYLQNKLLERALHKPEMMRDWSKWINLMASGKKEDANVLLRKLVIEIQAPSQERGEIPSPGY